LNFFQDFSPCFCVKVLFDFSFLRLRLFGALDLPEIMDLVPGNFWLPQAMFDQVFFCDMTPSP